MREPKLPRMQHLPRRVPFFPIKRVTHNRMPEMMQVHPDLMRPAAVQNAFEQAHSA